MDDALDAIKAFICFVIKWAFILTWRFFTGNFMDGQPRNDATWWRDASRKYMKQRRKWSWWKRKSRIKRMGWRHAIFWPCLILSVGFAVDPWGMFFILGMLSPGLVFLGWRRFRILLFIPVAGTHSDGITRQHWVMKPALRHLLDACRRDRFRMHPKYPGLLPDPEKRPVKPSLEDVPLEYANAIRAEVLEGAYDQPPIELKLLLDPDVDILE